MTAAEWRAVALILAIPAGVVAVLIGLAWLARVAVEI